jgi:hypothetical protein
MRFCCRAEHQTPALRHAYGNVSCQRQPVIGRVCRIEFSHRSAGSASEQLLNVFPALKGGDEATLLRQVFELVGVEFIDKKCVKPRRLLTALPTVRSATSPQRRSNDPFWQNEPVRGKTARLFCGAPGHLDLLGAV